MTPPATRLETDTSQRGQVITGEQTRALPLNGREYSSLALLTTGVRLSALNTGRLTPREGSFNVNGLRSTFNNFLIDGVDNNAYGTSNQGFSNQVMQPPPDAVAEFKVVTNNMSAEYGRAAGGDDQRRVSQRHQPVSRRGLGVPAATRRSTPPASSSRRPARSRRSSATSSAACSAARSSRTRRSSSPTTKASARRAAGRRPRRSRRWRSGRASCRLPSRDPLTGATLPGGHADSDDARSRARC